MEKTLLIKNGDFAIYRVETIVGGNYAVVSHKDKTAANGLCLDAAFDLFRQLTLEAQLRANKMIE